MSRYGAKYLRYKSKYLALKQANQIGGVKQSNQIGGVKQANQIGGINEMLDKELIKSSEPYAIGINFESGKIITWETKCKNCKAWANCQIGMDAPYLGRVADESVRTKGRSELSFPGYREDLLIENLKKILAYIKANYPNLLLVIQIARGRAGIQMFNEVIEPLLKDIERYKIQYGYRTANYFECRDLEEDFVFVNIGMFAVLTKPESIYVGELCNPVQTWSIKSYDKATKEFEIDPEMHSFETDNKNILNSIDGIQKIKLFGISDCMEFITPDIYDEVAIQKLIEYASISN